MKLHSLRLVVLALACIILGSSFTKTNSIKLENQTVYFWYIPGNDSFFDSNTTANEINEQQNISGYALVNTTAAGGTLLVKGYSNNNYPHTVLPSVLLYGH